MYKFETKDKTTGKKHNINILAKNKKEARSILKETVFIEIDSWKATPTQFIQAVINNEFTYCRFHTFRPSGFIYYNAYLPLHSIPIQNTGCGNVSDSLVA